MRKIKTYERLQNHVLAWRDRRIQFLVVVGPPGVGKSRVYEDALSNEDYVLFKGRTSAVQIYMTVYDDPDRRVVFDDVGQLLRDSASVELLKSLCDSRSRRVVQWNTATHLLDGRDKEFIATAPVLVVCNRGLADNEDVKAVIDRADAVEFDPPKSEVIRKLRTYADDEIVEFLSVMPVIPSLRTYELAKRWKDSRRLDWRQELMDECGVPDHVQALVAIIRTASPDERCSLYMSQTSRSKRDYYNQLPIAMQLLGVEADTRAILHGVSQPVDARA